MQTPILAILLAGAVLTGAACQAPMSTDTVPLQSRDIRPLPEGVSPDFLETLKRTPLPRLHAFVQLKHPPTVDTQRALAAKGIHLLFHVSRHLWAASIAREFPGPQSVQDTVRWIELIRPEDKLAPVLRAQRLYDWALTKDGRVRLSVEFFSDVPRSTAEAILKMHVRELHPWVVDRGWYIVAAPEVVAALVSRDEVKWVQPGPLPFQPLLNFTREGIHAEEVQALDLSSPVPVYRGLTGSGVRVGVWDGGIDRTHEDFQRLDAGGRPAGSRVLTASTGEDHGTAVGGVIGASGYRSAACGATPYLFRGVAPEAELFSWSPHPLWGPSIVHIASSIIEGMDVSNHSYVQETDGRYGSLAQQMDRLVRGGESFSGRPVPPRPMVWAAANNGIRPQYSSVEGYFSVETPAKNVITVGAVVANLAGSRDRLAGYSSLGPTWDGRIKPEVVAPGEGVRSTHNRMNCYTSGDSGTSIAAPAVTGSLVLMQQQYARTYGVDIDLTPPLPSTLKAVLIQTAKDLAHTVRDALDWDNPDTGAFVQYHAGPDYATGYGLINTLALISLIKEKKLVESQVARRTDMREHVFSVPAGTERIQFTLAWDDEPFEGVFAVQTEPRLVNDLDFSLVAPDGAVHQPWVLPPLTPAATIGDRDPIAPGDIRPAGRGRDRRNNVEQVTVDRPAPGRWVARVEVAASSPGMLATPQTYSLVGDFYSSFYFTDWAQLPGVVYEVRGGVPTPVYTAAFGHVYHSAFAPDGTLYVTNANDFTVMRQRPGAAPEVVYRHGTYVRDVAFDPAGQLYFSEASGAGADGVIYRLNPVDGTAVRFYSVRLGEMGGFWAGDFAFDPSGRLFLGTGNRVGGRVLRVDDPLAASPPVPVYTLSGEAVTGIAFNRQGELFFTNWDSRNGNIYRVSLADGRRDLVYSFPNRRIWDVSFR